MKSEQPIQSEVLEYLKSIGCYARKVVPIRAGTLDTVACCKGLFIAIETKTEIGETSKLQDYNVKMVHKAEGIAFVARSVQDVKDYFEKIKLWE